MTDKRSMDAKYICGSKFWIGTNYRGILELENDLFHTMRGQNMYVRVNGGMNDLSKFGNVSDFDTSCV